MCGEMLTIDEGVEDGHGAIGDTSVRVDLLEDCVKQKRRVSEVRFWGGLM